MRPMGVMGRMKRYPDPSTLCRRRKATDLVLNTLPPCSVHKSITRIIPIMHNHDFQRPMTRPICLGICSQIFALAILSLLLGANGALAAGNAADLRAPGPFPVGVTTAVLVDSNRTDAFTKE